MDAAVDLQRISCFEQFELYLHSNKLAATTIIAHACCCINTVLKKLIHRYSSGARDP